MDTKIGKLILTLTVIGIISAIALSFVYQWTTPYIEKHQLETRKEALRDVIPQAQEYKEVERADQTFYEGYDSGGNRTGVAMIASGPGYQNVIELMIGVNLNSQKIYGIKILTHEETPGLGARITGDEYKENYVDKPFGDYTVVKREPQSDLEVEAIAGATISSKSVAKIVENAVEQIQDVYGGGA
ncbi:MAG: RnfABCDGE type electron transport complex subunit G [Halanaerobiales bacterium]|nr:RnfABCDGE type electron transport complex subunit G [Halanaerobiales bacterium]